MSLVLRSNTYHSCLYYKGKQVWKSLKTKDKKIAKLKEAELIKRYLEPNPIKPIEWKTFCDRYLEYSKTQKSESTYKNDIQALNRFNTVYFVKNMNDFTPKLLEDYKIKLHQKGLKPSSVNRYLGLLKAMAKVGFEWEYINDNKFQLIKNIPEPERAVKYYKISDVKNIIKVAQTDFENVFLALAFMAGMRRDELRNLLWTNMDFDKKVIYIETQEKWATKTRKNRIVPMNDRLQNILLNWKKKSDSDYVLSLNKNRPMNKWYFSKMFYKLLKRAHLTGSVNWTRHTWTSHLAESGVNINRIQEWAGHSSVRTTERIYKHVMADVGKKEINLLPNY